MVDRLQTMDIAEELRTKLKTLREERDTIILEKGLAAKDNNDLRENFAYDYWEQKERNVTGRIRQILKELDGMRPKKPAPLKT